jgi:hypothetical protein
LHSNLTGKFQLTAIAKVVLVLEIKLSSVIIGFAGWYTKSHRTSSLKVGGIATVRKKAAAIVTV